MSNHTDAVTPFVGSYLKRLRTLESAVRSGSVNRYPAPVREALDEITSFMESYGTSDVQPEVVESKSEVSEAELWGSEDRVSSDTLSNIA